MLESLQDEAVHVKDVKADKMKVHYDCRVKTQKFELGDLVLLFNSALLKQWSCKLEEHWLGPYKVVWCGSQDAYSIINGAGATQIVSGDQIKKYWTCK